MTSKRGDVDVQLKILVIGDTSVGKTSLLLRYTDDKFSPSFVSTIGIDFKVKLLELDGQKVRMQIWDTAGQERFRTITTSYFRGAHGILLAFDTTDKRTFANVTNWLTSITEHADGDVALLLIGTKADMTDKQAVSSKEAEQLAAQHNIKYLPTSAKLNSNVKESFESLARAALLKVNASSAVSRKPSETIQPGKEDKKAGGAAGCAC